MQRSGRATTYLPAIKLIVSGPSNLSATGFQSNSMNVLLRYLNIWPCFYFLYLNSQLMSQREHTKSDKSVYTYSLLH